MTSVKILLWLTGAVSGYLGALAATESCSEFQVIALGFACGGIVILTGMCLVVVMLTEQASPMRDQLTSIASAATLLTAGGCAGSTYERIGALQYCPLQQGELLWLICNAAAAAYLTGGHLLWWCTRSSPNNTPPKDGGSTTDGEEADADYLHHQIDVQL